MRKYKLLSNSNYSFMTGSNPSGKQYLFGIIEKQLVTLQFSLQGGFEEMTVIETVDLSNKKRLFQDHSLKLRIIDEGITINKFWIEEYRTGIETLSNTLLDFLDNPSAYTPDERIDLTADVNIWKESGQYVFYWGFADFWVDGSGYVTSS